MKEQTKSQIFDFIKTKTPNLKEVIDVKIKDTDDDYGTIGEHYIVKCLVTRISPMSPTGFKEDVEKTCLVSVSEFKKWIRKEESIKWL
jgi:hypothetical protein